MTRSHKVNDVPHNHPEAEAHFAENQIPKYFGKQGHVDQAPYKIKKNGSGKGNWGRDGDELQDLASLDEPMNIFKARRRSNSQAHAEDIVKSKFEVNEMVPVFDEDVHGAVPEDADGAELESVATSDSAVSKVSGA